VRLDDDPLPHLHRRDLGSAGDDGPGRLVAEHDRGPAERVPTVPRVQVGPADAGRLHRDDDLVGARQGVGDLLHLDGALRGEDGGLHAAPLVPMDVSSDRR
jgi:hypothetical protein